MKNLFQKSKQVLNDNKLFNYLKSSVSRMGQKLIYSVLLMFYAYKRSETPGWAKNIILGTLVYVLSPIDGIPDLTPIFGFTDDLGVLSFGLVTIACYINEEVRSQSKEKMAKFISRIDENIIAEIDATL